MNCSRPKGIMNFMVGVGSEMCDTSTEWRRANNESRRRAPNREKPMVGVTIEKRPEIQNHEPLQLRFAAQIHQ